MKNYYVVIIVVVASLAVVGWFLTQNATAPKPQSNNSTPQTTKTVLMKDNSFEPETITIKKGATVIFKNEDQVARWPASNLHPTHGIYPEFDPRKPIESGDSWQFTFDKIGSWKYHDHLITSIKGTIIVE